MSSRDKKLSLAAAAIFVAAAVLVYRNWGSSEEDSPSAQATHWLCRTDGCKSAFTMTVGDLALHHERNYGKPVPCPQCKQSNTTRAVKCAACGAVSPLERGMAECPACKAKLAAG